MTDLWANWWVWIAAALVLAIAETILPGFIFLGFAVGAAVVGVITAIAGGAITTLAGTLVIFAIVSLAAWIGMRRYFKLPGSTEKTFDTDIND